MDVSLREHGVSHTSLSCLWSVVARQASAAPLGPLPKTPATVLDLLPFLTFLLLVGLRRLQQPLRLTQGWPSCPPLLRTSSASQPPSPCSHRLHKSKLHHHLSQTAPLRSDEA